MGESDDLSRKESLRTEKKRIDKRRCPFCGHLNDKTNMYCERCLRPLTKDVTVLKEWAITKFLAEIIATKLEQYPKIVDGRSGVRIGDLVVDYKLDFEDGSSIFVIVLINEEVKLIKNIISNLKRVNKSNYKLVFLILLTRGATVEVDDVLKEVEGVDSELLNVDISYHIY